jgi:hypothetical protein
MYWASMLYITHTVQKINFKKITLDVPGHVLKFLSL